VEVVDDELIRRGPCAIRSMREAEYPRRGLLRPPNHSAWRTALSIRWRWHFEPTTPLFSLSLSDGSLPILTTPIYYANDAPHVGNAYTTVNADALARLATG